MNLKIVVITLGVLGLIPFLLPVYWAFDDRIILGLAPLKIFSTYSSVILTFLAGSLWSQVILSKKQFLYQTANSSESDNEATNETVGIALAFISNFLALVCWVLLILPKEFYVIALMVQLIGFVIVLWVEAGWNLLHHKVYRNGYLTLRCVLTVIVCSANITMILLNFQ